MLRTLTIAGIVTSSLGAYTLFSIYSYNVYQNDIMSNWQPDPIIVNLGVANSDKNSDEGTGNDLNSIIDDALSKPEITELNLTKEQIDKLISARDPYETPEKVKEMHAAFVSDLQEKEIVKIEEDEFESAKQDFIKNKEKVSHIVKTFAELYKVDENLIYAVIEEESEFEFNVTKEEFGTKKKGAMLVDEALAEGLAAELGIEYTNSILLDVTRNIQMGTYLISKYQEENEDLHFVLNMYKKGREIVDEFYVDHATYKSGYSNRVLERLSEIETYN